MECSISRHRCQEKLRHWRPSPSIQHMRGLARVLDLLFPPRCPSCLRRSERVELCGECLAAIRLVASPLCPCCGLSFAGVGPDHRCARCLRRRPRFDRARACAVYRSGHPTPVIDMIHRFKYGREVGLGPVLGGFLADRCPLPVDHDIVIPVPLHIDRLRWRGFNQAAVLARAVARRHRRPIDAWVLARRDPTSPQVGLDAADRLRNVRGAFAVRDAAAVCRRSVLLIDDVMTTGATVDECARTLRRAGARRVDVAVLARAADA
jgi:ComF family protein